MQLKELEALIEQMQTYPCYLMLALPRTGNTAVWTALNRHPKMHWSGEIWAVASQNGKDHGKTCGQRLLQVWGRPCGGCSTTHAVEFLDEPFHPEYWDIKMPYVEAHQKGFFDKQHKLSTFIWPIINHLRDHLKVLRLGRRNEIARYVSGMQARSNNVWHIWEGRKAKNQQLLNAKPVVIDVRDLESHIQWRRAQWQGFRDMFPDSLELYHEDLVADPRKFFRGICDYLGVPPKHLRPEVRKNPTPWHARVINYQEIREHFRSRPEFDHCFEEP